MGKKEKLIARLKSVPKDFTFDELKTLLGLLGYDINNAGKTSGSRVTFERDGTSLKLHKPHPQKELQHYQIKEVIADLKRRNLL